MIEDAGRQKIPFTTGILIGIGETVEERVDALAAIRELHEKYGHIQEVIVQNFRAKPATPMAGQPEPDRNDMLRTLAVSRLMMPAMNIQAPPNLSDPHYADLLDGGINDWGGISPLTPDFINPEKPWPHIDELRMRTEANGFELRQRLPVYDEFAAMAERRGGLLGERMRARDPRDHSKGGGMITVLTGGTGGAKFVDGLRQVVPQEELTIIVNTGDDMSGGGCMSHLISTRSRTCWRECSARNAAGA